MATKSDFEKTIQGLKNNRHGMIAEPAGEQQEEKKPAENIASCSRNIKPSGNVQPPKQNEIVPVQKIDKKDESKDEKNKCLVCKKPSNTVCQRCGDCYCSAECQNADWEVHRYVCIAKPKLVNNDSAEVGIVPIVTAEVPKLSNRNSQTEHQKAISKAKLPLSSKPTSNINTFVNVASNAPPKIVSNDASQNTLAKPILNNNNNGPPMVSPPENKTHSDLEVQNNDNRVVKNSTQITATNTVESFSFNKLVPNASCDEIKSDVKPNESIEEQTQKESEKDHTPKPEELKKKEQETQEEKGVKQQPGANDAKVEEPSVAADWNQNFPKRVCITACCKSNLLCVRLLEKQQNDEYIKMLDKTNSLGKNSMQLEKLPNTGDLVITDYEDKTLCRARIFHVINEHNIIVKFIDIGPLQTKELKQLRKFPDDLPKTENFIRAIKLFQVPDFKLNSEAVNLLDNYIRHSTEMKMFCFNKEKEPEYILKENCTNENINELILKFNGKGDSLILDCKTHERSECSSIDKQNEKVAEDSSGAPSRTQNDLDAYKNEEAASNGLILTSNSSTVISQNTKSVNESLPSEVELESSVVFAKDIQWDVLPNEEYVNVYVADNSLLKDGIVSCINLKKLTTVKQFNQAFDDFARTMSETYIPRTSEICLALNEEDRKWYRAEFMERLNNERASLKFIDLGCIKDVQMQNIRKYPKDLMQPCHTSTCMIAGLSTPLDEKIISDLQKLFPLKGKTILDRVEAGPDAKMNLIHVDFTEVL